MSAFLAALMLVLSIVLDAKNYNSYTGRQVTRESFWSTYAIMFLKTSGEFAVISLIFGIVVWKNVRGRFVNDASAIALGTFSEDTTSKHHREEQDKDKTIRVHNVNK